MSKNLKSVENLPSSMVSEIFLTELSKINPLEAKRINIASNPTDLVSKTGGRLILLFFLVSFALLIPLLAQTSVSPAGNALGSPYGSYSLSELESISLYSGKVNTVVPLVKVGGRGNAGYSMSYPIKDARWYTEVEITTNGIFPLVQDHPDRSIKQWRTVFLRSFEFGTVSLRYTSRNHSCHDGSQVPYCWTFNTLTAVFTSADGTEHELFDEKQGGIMSELNGVYPNETWVPALERGLIFSAKDGSGWTFVGDPEFSGQTDYLVDAYGQYYQTRYDSEVAERTASGYLKNNDGTVVRFENSRAQWIKDRNGNKTTFIYETSGTNKLDKVIDPNARETDIVYGSGYEQVVYLGTSGQPRTITINHSTLQYRLSSGNSLLGLAALFPAYSPQSPYSFASIVGNYTYNPSVVSTISLPDNRAYGFFYNSYGELSRVESPTGAAVEYTYGAGVSTAYASGQVGALYPTGYPSCNLDCLDTNVLIFRRLLERREYPNGGSTPTLKTTYGLFDTSTGKVREEQIDPATATVLARTDRYFLGDPTASLNPGGYVPTGVYALLDGREFKSERLDVGTNAVLARSETNWNSGCLEARSTCGTGTVPVPWAVFAEWTKASIYEPSTGQYKVSKVESAYDKYNNLTDSYEYDFGTNAPGSFIRRSHTDYVTSSNYTSATGPNLKSLPSQTWVSSNSAGTTKVSLTNFEYDNYTTDSRHAALVSRSSVVGFDSSNFGTGFSYRGNLTGITWYANASSQTGGVTRSMKYDVLGNVVQMIDPRGYSTSIGYIDNFGSPDSEATTNTAPSQLSGNSTFALPTSMTNNTFNWTEYCQFDYFLGQPVNTKDINNVISKTVYSGSLDRLAQTTRAVGQSEQNQTTIAYDDANRKVTTTSDLASYNDNAIKSEILYDGLGRTTETRRYESSTNYIKTTQTYDPLGRIKRTYNPHRTTSDSTYGYAENTYDSIGRVTTVATSDGSSIGTSYSGNSITVTDEAGKQRRGVTDALGRLTIVYEPDQYGTLNVNTDYTYDVLDNLTQVNQGAQIRTFAYDGLSRLATSTNPESGFVEYYYDANGNLTEKQDPRSIGTYYTYDALNRITQRTYDDGTTPTVTYTYDNITNGLGRLTKVANSNSETYYTAFDKMGRVTSHKQALNGYEFPTYYTYNLAGMLLQETYPSARVVKNTIGSFGDLSQVETKPSGGSFATRASNFVLSAPGVVQSLQLGNSKYETTAFNSRMQVTQIGLGTSTSDTSLLKLEYGYGSNTTNNGNVTSQAITVPSLTYTFNQSYTYDNLNRIATATETYNNSTTWSQTFGYDRYGNRNITAGTGATSLTFNASTNKITTSGYVYDNNGNTTAEPGSRSYTYDAENKMLTASGSSGTLGNYAYDGDGKRVKKYNTAIGDNRIFLYDAAGKLIEERDLSNNLQTSYIYSGSRLLSIENASTATTDYLTGDTLGTPRINSDGTGAVTARHDYLPFGEEIFTALTSHRTPGVGYPGSDGIRQQFTGYERDDETGLDFAQARMYASSLGRFVSPDPRRSRSIFEPTAWNLYSYALNSPGVYTDRVGRWPERIHRAISDAAFPGLDPTARAEIARGNAEVDLVGLKPYTLWPPNSHEHSMTSDYGNNDPGVMAEKRDAFTKAALAVAKDPANRYANGLGNSVAYYAFGRSRHPWQDAVSPMHSGINSHYATPSPLALSLFPQYSIGKTVGDAIVHWWGERKIDDYQFAGLVRAERDAFREVFGDEAFQRATDTKIYRFDSENRLIWFEPEMNLDSYTEVLDYRIKRP